MMNTVFTLKIDGLAFGGAGVGRDEGGKVVFVRGAYPGDVALVRAEKNRKRHIEAGLVRVLEPSPHRVFPACPHSEDCGGCPWMGLSYGVQLKWKQKIVEDLLKRIGGMKTAPAKAKPSPKELGYRARVRLKVAVSRGVTRIGYHRPRSNDIVNISRCPVANGKVNEILEQIRSFLGKNPGPFQDVGEIEIETGGPAESGRVILHTKKQMKKEVVERFLESIPSLQAVAARHGGDMQVAGDAFLETRTLDGMTLRFRPGVFSQVNPGQNLEMTKTVRRLAGLSAGMSGLDLFCGMGNLTIPLAAAGAAMTGVEANPLAVADANSNRDRLRVMTASFSEGSAKEATRKMLREGLRFDTVIADPPRGGIANMVSEAAGLARERIVYISCDPAAMARDAGKLAELGFHLQSVEPCDMFPQTSHVEVVSLFTRRPVA